MFGIGVPEVLVVLVLALTAVIAFQPGRRSYDIADETVVHGVSAEVADQVLFRELGALRSLTLVASHAGSFTLARTSRSWLALAGAVVLFPFGLVFLLLKQEHRIQVSVTPHPDGCRVRVLGRAQLRDVAEVTSALQRVLPVPEIAVR